MNRPAEPPTLIPETPILVYPSVATSIGLECATMLSLLTQWARGRQGLSNNGFLWYALDEHTCTQLMPFWQPMDIQRIAAQLRELGLLLIASAPYGHSRQLKFALNLTHAPQTAPQPPAAAGAAPNKNPIGPSWQPDRETLGRLAQHNVTQQFALEQVAEFVNYWRGRGEPAHAWGAKFFQHTLRKWREFESQSAMTPNWRPSEDALDILVRHGGISRQFVEDAIAEFVLYWREQGSTSDNWNKKFRDHVHHQWLKYRSALEHDPTPRRMEAHWVPSDDVFEVLRLANIDLAFAKSLIAEFVIYWRDSNQVHYSWNTRFLQYVKQRWAKRDLSGASSNPSTRDISLAEQLTDRSWAS